MKKVAILLLAISLLLGLIGCSTQEKPSTSIPSPSTSQGGVQLPDQSF